MAETKPIFVATHPRACSTALERVFMTRRDLLKCVHEPFGDAYYFGPERLAERYAQDEKSREASGFAKSTYQIIMERINIDNTEGKRLFIKDMAQYFCPPSHKAVSIAPSLLDKRRGVGTEEVVDADSPAESPSAEETNRSSTAEESHADSNGSSTNGPANGVSKGRTGSMASIYAEGDMSGSRFATMAGYNHTLSRSTPAAKDAPYPTFTEPNNPTVVPTALLRQFQFAFLIRHPRYSIPSYYRCCIPPLDSMTGFHNFRPDEAGYEELRRVFDYLRESGHIGPVVAGSQKSGEGETNGGAAGGSEICMVDADDLLDDPEGIMSAFCKSVGIPWTADMLNWNGEEDRNFAQEAFEKWKGFHEDAIHSNDLKARTHKHVKSDEELYKEWVAKYGQEGADVIRQTVADCVGDYEYLKQFCIKAA